MASFIRSISNILGNGGTVSSAHNQRRDQAMSSTHDAFSIPNHSPTFQSSSFSDAQDDARYTYPPAPSPNTYDFSPSTASTPYTNIRPSRQSSLLPLHNPSAARQAYPAIQQSWARIQEWLAKNYPELGDTLNYGIIPEDLEQLELSFGFSLPHAVRESYLIVDGQERESSGSCTEGLFFGLTLLPLEDVLEEWRFWREVDEDPATGANPQLKDRMRSIPAGWIHHEYSTRGWIPLVTDRVGNYIGIDLNPGQGGAIGQVICFGRDFDTKVVLWRGDGEGGWARWLAFFADELEAGDSFEIGGGEWDSDGSEDSIGHEPYFFDGSAGGARGEGGGADRGAVGLHLTGEYRGWPVLEALAEKSVKHWKEVGLLQDGEYPALDTRRASVAIDGLRGIPVDRAAEVHIPTLGDGPSNDASKPLPPEPETPRARTHNKQAPSVSINRPLPQPLDLPTASDIAADAELELETPRDERDLENGRSTTMREIDAEFAQRVNKPALLTGSVNETIGLTTEGPFLSPRISSEDSTLLENAAIVTPSVTTFSQSSPIIQENGVVPPAKDLLNDEPDSTPQTISKSLPTVKDDPVDTQTKAPSVSDTTTKEKDAASAAA